MLCGNRFLYEGSILQNVKPHVGYKEKSVVNFYCDSKITLNT